jgi:hypothetical protein
MMRRAPTIGFAAAFAHYCGAARGGEQLNLLFIKAPLFSF